MQRRNETEMENGNRNGDQRCGRDFLTTARVDQRHRALVPRRIRIRMNPLVPLRHRGQSERGQESGESPAEERSSNQRRCPRSPEAPLHWFGDSLACAVKATVFSTNGSAIWRASLNALTWSHPRTCRQIFEDRLLRSPKPPSSSSRPRASERCCNHAEVFLLSLPD